MAELVLRTEIDVKNSEKELNRFKKELQQYDNEAQKLTKQQVEIRGSESFQQYEQALKQLEIEFENFKKTTDYDINEQTRKTLDAGHLRDIEYVKQQYSGILTPLSEIDAKLQEIRTSQGLVSDKVNNYTNKIDEAKVKLQEVGEEGEIAGERSGRGFEKGITSLKRFALSLFGIRSMFSLVRRATSTYLSQHEDTANKINAIWVALGNALAPIIEAIANMVLKFIGYLNVFLQALGFDVDLTKGMNKSTKAINGTTKAMKELNNQVASFDEMNVVQKETSSSGGGAGGSIGGDSGFKMPELDPRIVQFLQDTAHWLQENWDWISKILLVVAGIKIAKWLSSLGELSGALGGLATLGVIAVGVDLLYNAITGRDLINDLKEIYDGLKQLRDIEKDHAKNNKAFAGSTQQKTDAMKDEAKQYKKNSKEEQEYFEYLREVIEAEASGNEALAKKIDKMSGAEFWYKSLTGEIDDYDNELIDNNKNMRYHIQAMVDEYNQGKLNEDQEKKLFEILGSLNATIEDGTVKYKDMDGSVLEASKHVGDYTEVTRSSGRELEYTSTRSKQMWEGLSSTLGNENERMKRSVDTTWNGIYNVVQTEMNKMNSLRANPQVNVKMNTTNLSSTLEAMNNSSFLQSLGMTKGLSATIQKLRSIGMARGGIVYNPGRGVSLSNVVVGEATGGAEGIIPMNNEQSMALIGESIARHVNINLTNTTMLDSKVISRTTKQVENEANFATNGRGVR